MSSSGRLSAVVVLLALIGAGCGSGAAAQTKNAVPPASIAVSVSRASAPGGGLDPGLDGSVASGSQVSVESQVGGYLLQAVVSIKVGHAPSPPPNQSPNVGEYEVAHIALKVLDGRFSYSSAQFTFIDASGHRFTAVAGDLFAPSLGTGTAVVGKTITGNVVFNVPAGGGTVELRDVSGPRLAGWTTRH